MTNVVQGRDVLFLVYKTDGYVPYVCAKDVAIATTTAFVETTTKGDGHWKKKAPQTNEYGISLSGVNKFDNTAFTSFDLIEQQINFMEVRYKLLFTDEEDQNTKMFKGSFFVENSSLSGNATQASLAEFSFTGNGAYGMYDCDVSFEGIDIEVSGSDITGTILGLEGTPTGYLYQLDNGFETPLTVTTGSFSITGIADGFHTLIVTPYCGDDDHRGPAVTETFNIGSVGVDTGCPNVVDFSISAITHNSFVVNYVAPPGAVGIDIHVKNVETQEEFVYYSQLGTSKLVKNLAKSTEYEVTLITRCTPTTVSGGISAIATTLSTTVIYLEIINNSQDGTVVDDVQFNGSGVADAFFPIISGTVPVTPGNYAQASDLNTGAQQILVVLSNPSATETLQIITDVDNFSEVIASQAGIYTDITINRSGVTVIINP